MRTFASVWPDREIVQQVAAQIPWFHHCVLLDKVSDHRTRLWYAKKARAEGWSRRDDLMRHPDDAPTIGLLLCKGKDRTVVEYALRGFEKPTANNPW
jgi:hypothetical protein